MVQTHIKPHDQQLAEAERRCAQQSIFRRNQVFGLLIAAAAVVFWTILHTRPEWIFPALWWRR